MSKTKKYIITAVAVIVLLYITLIPKRVWIYIMNEKNEPIHVTLTYNDKVIVDEMMKPSFIVPYRYKGTGVFGIQDVQITIDEVSYDMSVFSFMNRYVKVTAWEDKVRCSKPIISPLFQ